MNAGMGSEYSSGALVLYKLLNPNIGKAGYSVPRALTGTPCYLKLNAGGLTLGVGINKSYTAGEAVTVTEYTLLHQGNSFYLGVPTTYVPVRMPEDKAALASGNGYLEWWNSGAGWVNHRAGKYIVNGGSSSQFLKGDGSLDSTAYLPLTGGTLTGQLTIKQSVDIKLRLLSTDTDNYCIIQALNAQASQLGVLGYAGDKWAIGHGGDYYEIWDKYNLSDPLKKSEAVTLYYPYNGRGYLTINSSGRPIMSNNQGYAVTDKDGNAREVLWMGTDNVLKIGNTSQYTLNQLDLRCTTLTHNGNSIATQNYVTNQLANYLPLTGGNLTGKLSIKSSGSNLLILDSSSSTESVIHFLRSSTSKGAVGYYDNIGAFIYNFPSNTYLFVKDDGKPYVGTRTDYKKILTETDITGYATQTWVNSQNFVKSTSTRKVKDIQIVDTLPTTQASGVLYLVVK